MTNNTLNILIVEDEGIVAMDLKMRLSKMGYGVLATFAMGEDALLFVKNSRPDLVLMDINLQGKIDGIQTAHRMRAEYEIPIVFTTAYSDDKTLERAKITEAYGYLVKPCGDKELRVAIEIGIYKAKADQKLRALQRWLASTMKSLGDGVIGTDLAGIINYMNPIAESLTGWTFKEAENRPLREVFNAIDEKSRTPVENLVERALIEGIAVSLERRTLLIRKDGTEMPVDDSCAPNTNEKNIPIGAVIVFRDASPLRIAEAEAMRAKEIAYRNEKLASLGKIAGGVAHDINNLMTIVMGYSEMLLIEMPESIAAKRLRTVFDAGLKAAGVARNLLSYSRQSPLLPEVFDFNDSIRGMDRILNAIAIGKVELKFNMASDTLLVRADKSQINQVLLNLGVNACEAMITDGIITVSTERIEIPADSSAYGLMAPGPAMKMSFADTGPGIDEETMTHLFEPYFTRKEPGKGTGLGLATVAGILAQCGGHIFVESQIGKGATFYVYLPLIELK